MSTSPLLEPLASAAAHVATSILGRVTRSKTQRLQPSTSRGFTTAHHNYHNLHAPSPIGGAARCCGIAVRSASESKFPNDRARRAGPCSSTPGSLELPNGDAEGVKSLKDWLARITLSQQCGVSNQLMAITPAIARKNEQPRAAKGDP